MKSRHRIALAVYAGGAALLSLVAPWVWRWRSRREPLYAERARAKTEPPEWRGQPPDVWVHAVSVGEFVAVRPLLEHWLRLDRGIVLTTTTPTGAQHARDWLVHWRRAQPDARLVHAYFPIDRRRTWQRWLEALQPKRIVVVETEVWPLLALVARRMGTPLYLLNGRLSKRSARRYARAAWLFEPVWASLAGVYARSPWDAHRFCALGVPRARVRTCGDLKTVQPVAMGEDDGHSDRARVDEVEAVKPTGPLLPRRAETVTWIEALKARWSGRPVLVVASTHDGEEARLFPAIQTLTERRPDLVVVVAPRHPHRCDAVQALFGRAGWSVERWSVVKEALVRGTRGAPGGDDGAPPYASRADRSLRTETPTATSDDRAHRLALGETARGMFPCASRRSLWLIDTLGDLAILQRMADCVWLGGSWVPVGGHNPIEALRAGVPVVTGPHIHNFAWWIHRLSHKGWVLKASADSPRLIDRTLDLLREDAQAKVARKMGFAAECVALSDYARCVEKVW